MSFTATALACSLLIGACSDDADDPPTCDARFDHLPGVEYRAKVAA